jgi:hypothetical protein
MGTHILKISVTNAYERERERSASKKEEEGRMYYTFDENTAQIVESVTRYSSCAQRQEEVRLPQHDLARDDHILICVYAAC